MRSTTLLSTFCILIVFALACKTPLHTTEIKIMGNLEKFDFDINALDKDGLMGPSTGKVSVDFQFCIPKSEAYEKAVLDIDPAIKIYQRPRGRNRCTETQVTAVGSTHKPGHREILLRLSELDFVTEIKRIWYE